MGTLSLGRCHRLNRVYIQSVRFVVCETKLDKSNSDSGGAGEQEDVVMEQEADSIQLGEL